MSLELAIILGFIFHLVGDYLFQNDWMAVNKVKSSYPALIHASIYSVPFLFLTSLIPWLIICGTHFFIDRYRLAQYWIRAVNAKKLKSFVLMLDSSIFEPNDIVNCAEGEEFKILSKPKISKYGTNFSYEVTEQIEGVVWRGWVFPQDNNAGYWEDKPTWMSVWLMIIIDNTFHILINTACIMYSFS